jgi:nucleosome binding factor SPN SPT16 subunit
MIVNPTDR